MATWCVCMPSTPPCDSGRDAASVSASLSLLQTALFTVDGPVAGRSPPATGWLAVPSSSAADATVPVVRVALAREASTEDVDGSGQAREAAAQGEGDASEPACVAVSDAEMAHWTVARSASPLPPRPVRDDGCCR
jgi:hypothetical protein